VECVASTGNAAKWGEVFVVGAVYRVRDCGPWLLTDQTWVSIEGKRDPEPYPGWDAGCFRPIYRPDEKLIRDLLQPVEEFA
jgi:hypothetical protein